MSSDLIVLSHQRWDGAWGRVHHIVSRLARGRTTWFVEEPRPGPVDRPRFVRRDDGGITRLWLEVPIGSPGDFGATAHLHRQQLVDLVGPGGSGAGERIVWMCTALAADVASQLGADVVVYDAVDQPGPSGLVSPDTATARKAALTDADVVLTGSSSQHRSVIEQGRPDAYLVADGVDPEHFASARSRRPGGDRGRPVAAYVGPIDRRIDLALVAALAEQLPAWRIWMVGPIDGLDPTSLPWAGNLHHMGPKPYAELPGLLAGVDVAIIPFSVGAATAPPSGTNTLEYLAAGLPVVSTPVSDVVTQFGTLVDVQDDAGAFAGACNAALRHDARRRHRRVAPLLRRRHWDVVVDEIRRILGDAGTRPPLEDLLA